ncbi:MAG: hypothetical protein Q3996_01330 [Candidatus Saccharibacteria bacterium]|nr:hypothetical protein [Candidatus Saccharibacteria bacterium]
MDEIKKFISEMRAKNLSDELIYKNLLQKGWDEKMVNEAFLPDDVVVPTPSSMIKKPAEQAATNTKESKKDNTAEIQGNIMISKSESVLHHVFLWIFSIAFIVNVQILVGMIKNNLYLDDKSLYKTIFSSLSALLITGLVYGLFYWQFIKKLKKDWSLRFNNGWNLASVILGSLVGIGSLIYLVSSLIWCDDSNLIVREIIPRFVPIIVYSGVVVLNYSQINFSKPDSRFRKRYSALYYWLFIVITSIAMLVYAAASYSFRKSDIELREAMVKVINENYAYYKKNGKIAKDLNELNISNSAIEYKVLKNTTDDFTNCNKQQSNCLDRSDSPSFELCGNFKYQDNSRTYNYKNEINREIDIYRVDAEIYDLTPKQVGRNCFKITLHNSY